MIAVQNRIGSNIKRLRATLERFEGGRDILHSPNFESNNIEANRAGCGLSFAHFQHRGGIAGIGHDRQMAQTGDNLAQEFEPLAGKIGGLGRQAGDVAARSRQAWYEAGADRIVRRREHDRDNRCHLLCCEHRPSHRYDHIDLESDKLGGNLAKALGTPLRPTILDRHGATLDPAEFAQSLNKGGCPCTPGRRSARSKEPNDRHLRWLLRPRRERPRYRTTEQCDELASLNTHSITSSARASRVGGISRPIAFAVLRLIVSSNFVGCSIGRSAGLAPCKIRLTYQAPRLNKSDRDVPYDIRPPASTFSFVWYIAGKRCFSMKPIISPMCRWIRRSFVVANAFGFLCIIAANAGSSASLVRIGTEINCRPSAGTAMINSSRKARFESLSGFHRKATRARPGTQSFKTSSRLPMRSGPRMVVPVIFRSGRARFVAKPALTGSPTAIITIGTVDVACRTARVAGEPYVTMTFTGSEASSRAA